MIFPVAQCIEVLSPEGVGAASGRLEGIGVLENRVVAP